MITAHQMSPALDSTNPPSFARFLGAGHLTQLYRKGFLRKECIRSRPTTATTGRFILRETETDNFVRKPGNHNKNQCNLISGTFRFRWFTDGLCCLWNKYVIEVVRKILFTSEEQRLHDQRLEKNQAQAVQPRSGGTGVTAGYSARGSPCRQRNVHRRTRSGE